MSVLFLKLNLPQKTLQCVNCSVLKSARGNGVRFTQIATLMKCEPPPSFDHIEFPERRRLRFLEKVPMMAPNMRPPKMMKDLFLMRGPERIHNKLQYGDYGIQAITGGRLRWGHLEMIRLTINRKIDESRMFAIWRLDPPWQPITKKGQGHRMGSGKGAINHYVTPLRADRIIVEIGGKCEFREVQKILRQVAKLLPFKARVVNREMLEEKAKTEKFIEENNLNPFTFKHCARNNMLGCKTWLSPYDYLWHGKHK